MSVLVSLPGVPECEAKLAQRHAAVCRMQLCSTAGITGQTVVCMVQLIACSAPAAEEVGSCRSKADPKLMSRACQWTAKVVDDLVWDDVAHIVRVRQFGEGNTSHFSLLKVGKSWPSAVACTAVTLLSAHLPLFDWKSCCRKRLMIT